MKRTKLEEKAAKYLQILCQEIPNRRVGSEGNRRATKFFADTIASFGFSVAYPEFGCIDWIDGGAKLLAPREEFKVFSSPYSLAGQVKAPLVIARSLEELEKLNPETNILLLIGEIAKEQLMPKNFPFYNPEQHKKTYQLLERKAPLAIITATSRNPELAGGMYPFPMIEDGDFNIPTVYMKDFEGEKLATFVGQEVALTINATRIPAKGHNVIARKQPVATQKIVLCAHIDAKDNTPGALDNGTGIVMLLLLAEMLEEYSGKLQIEIVALNGEDHYSAQGQKEYLKDNLDSFGEIMLAINTDVAGYIEGHSAFSLYGCSAQVEAAIRKTMSSYDSLNEGEQWYQSDHSIFIQNGCPAVAVTSDRFMELSAHVTHTPKDNLNLVDNTKIVDVALALKDVVHKLNQIS